MSKNMKRVLYVLIIIICFLIVCCAGWILYNHLSVHFLPISTMNTVRVDYEESEYYSKDDIDAAVAAVKKDFLSMRGCKLYALQYAGDEKSNDELATYNRDLPETDRAADCIVLNSVFRSPIRGGGAWNANEIYTWNWIVVKDSQGNWIVVNKGYA